MQEADFHDGEGPARRACDQCRLRKIRCDKDSPCANCKTANRACSSTGAGQRPKETRQRVLISTQYERKIDHFESRLENIENMIRDLAISIHARSPSASVTEPVTAGPGGNNNPIHSSPATITTPTNTTNTNTNTTTATAVPETTPGSGTGGSYASLVTDDDASVSAFEGGSSMAAQTVFASEFLEHAVAHTLPPGLDPDMQSALMSLQQIVAMQNRPSAHESRFVHAKPLPPGGLRELPMPPAHVVVTALREMKKDDGLVSFASICLFVVGGNFAERCSKVYFATEDFNIMSWGVVNGGLFFLLQDKAAMASGPEREQLLEYMALCRDNLETALSNMPLLMPARKESIELLLMGAFYAIEISKFSVARDLTAAAATLCQTLGYHRISNDDPDDEEAAADPAAPVDTTAPARAILFWAAYLLDKALSMRSGRAPAIQDYDITVARGLDESIDMPDDSWRFVLNQWIAYADVLGKAYEQLYSPAALAAPLEQRSESARQMIQTMLNLSKKQEPLMRHTREKMRGVRFDAHSQFPMEMAILGDELTHWSSLTLVYRAMPSPPGSPSTFNPECIHAAREAFRCHQEYMDMAGDSLPVKAGCIKWNLIYVPFTPLIILFCHIIETSDTDDLRRLADFTYSMEPVCADPTRAGAGEYVVRFHRVCQVLYNVANLCVRARAHRMGMGGGGPAGIPGLGPGTRGDPHGLRDHDMVTVGDNIDMYLSQLGFVAPPYGTGAAVGGHPHAMHDPHVPGTTGPGPGQHHYGHGGSGNGPGGMYGDAGYGPAAQANQLGNWFSGNTHILGLLEEDLSQFEPRMWTLMGGQ